MKVVSGIIVCPKVSIVYDSIFWGNAATDNGNETNCIILKLKADCKKRIPSGDILNDTGTAT